MQLTINIQDDYAQNFINFLKTLNYVNFENQKIDKKTDKKEFLKYSGLWKNREVNIVDLRDKAWKR